MAARRKQVSAKKIRRTRIRRTCEWLLTLSLIVGVLYIGDQIGMIDVDWQQLYQYGKSVLQQQIDRLYTPQKPAIEPVSGEWYRIYFTTPRYPDDPTARVDLIVLGLIDVIDHAQHSLDIAIYELNLDQIADAISNAKRRGVRVRIVTDSDSLDQQEPLQHLEKRQVPIVPDERSSIMHNKFVVADRQIVWTGSWNFTINDTFRNNNNAICIHSAKLAENYTVEFEEMFIHKAFGQAFPNNTPYPIIQLGDALIETCFAPDDHCADELIQRIHQAKQSIRFMAFAFTHDGIGRAVREQAASGVFVQGIFESNSSDNPYSEFGRMKRQKLDVLQDGNPYMLHHKVFILDEQIVVTGSFNFSDSADRKNDENMLIIHNAAIAKAFLEEFSRVYAEAKHPVR